MKVLKYGYVEFDASIQTYWQQQGITHVVLKTVEDEMYDEIEEAAFQIIPQRIVAGTVTELNAIDSEYVNECASGEDPDVKFIVHDSDL